MGLANLTQYKCKTCGEPLDVSLAKDGVIKCKLCESVFTLPKMTADQKVISFLLQGEHDLDTGKFEDAYTAYSKACELDKTEPEAYFGMALAEFKVQYLKDEVNNRLQPICHEVSDKDFADSANFLKALRYATDAQRTEYERRAEEINYIKNEFYKIQKSGLKYDCFICVKVSDENGGRTEDYKIADDIYFELKGKGYKPFFSERELKDVTGADYEARILYALKSAECMLVICLNEAYLRTKWVKNEYTRFLKLVNDEEKESDSIALVFDKKPIEKLPGKRGKIQGIQLGITAIDRIVSFVEAHTPEAKRRREEQARKLEEDRKRKDEEAEILKKQLAEQAEELRQFKELLKKQQSQTAVAQAPSLSDEELFERMERARIERERKAKQEAERRAKEEAERKAREKAEAERKAKEEAERKAKEERERKEREEAERKAREEAERKAREKEEAERKAREEAERQAKIEQDFEIVDGVLKEYNGNGGEVVIPDGVTSIGEWAFSGCKELTSITIADSVTEIGENAFSRCSGLTSVTIGNGVRRLFYEAFWYCTGLTSITISDGVTWIGDRAFIGCSGLERITVGSNNATYKSVNNCLLTKDGKTLVLGCKNSIIPNSVTSIGKNAFDGCWALKSITIPNSVTSIGEHAFSKCSGLTSITIPNSVTSIGKNAFDGCWAMKSITIPNSVASIGDYAFAYCSKLTNITIPDSVTNIGDYAFANCSNLLTIYCRAKKQPRDWNKNWNKKYFSLFGRHKVVWGYKGE